MIADFDDFCLYVYCIVDEICQRIQPLLHRPGPQPTTCSDSELLTLALVGECRGWDVETELLSHWRAHHDLFPTLPSQSRFNRRRRNLARICNVIRQAVLQLLDVAQDPLTVIDSLPVPVVQFHWVPSSTADWDVHDAAFGYCAAKKQTIYGYKLHLLLTVGGVILDFELAPANATDLAVGAELLAEHTDLSSCAREWFLRAFGDDRQAAWSTRVRSRSKFARPNIWRLSSFRRFTCPSSCPFDHTSDSPAFTAA
jgi:hypothetical protein